ncbi:DedA family protein [Candidatus Woesearchaeota archaeon]|nr:DedA family protein [Candidatus Woesearchaeota archaeon]
MNWLFQIFDYFMHLDTNLAALIAAYGVWVYAILFFVIFLETGFVVTPFLPGDSLLFAAGAFAAIGSFNIAYLFLLLGLAAILGDTINYWIGHFIGPKVFKSKKSLLFNKEHLIKAHKFYEKYGANTIILARFIPIIRTFAPFVAGIGKMHYGKFLSYNIFGGLLWVSIFLFGGFYFGNMPFVKANFEWVILAIIIVSVIPAVVEYIRNRKN